MLGKIISKVKQMQQQKAVKKGLREAAAAINQKDDKLTPPGIFVPTEENIFMLRESQEEQVQPLTLREWVNMTEEERKQVPKAVIDVTFKKSKAPAVIPTVGSTENESLDDVLIPEEAAVERLEKSLRDTKAILQVTKHTVRRKKLEEQIKYMERRLKEFQPTKNNI